MKILNILFILFFFSCTSVISQQPSEEMKKEKQFEEILRSAKEQRQKNIEAIKQADNKTKSVIQETSKKIITLKEEVKELKKELNEISVISNNAPKFKLLPISDSSEAK